MLKKLTRNEAQVQARRLQSSPALAPQSDDGRKEIVDCLLRHCADADHAERAMTHFIDSCADPRNLTAELSMAAMATAQGPQIPAGCEDCRRVNPLTGLEEFVSHVPGERNGYSCAVRCGCARGQWFARRDKERAAAATAELQESAPKPAVASVSDWAKKAAGDCE